MKKVYVKVNSLKELQTRMNQWCQSLDFVEYNISNLYSNISSKISDK